MQSCLEKRGIEERKNETVKSDYQRENNEYSRNHVDAISDGDAKGRGSKNIFSHGTYQPHYGQPTDYIDNFDTHDETIGTCYDINGRLDIGGRKKSQQLNLFKSTYQYNRDLIGTKLIK